MASTSPSGRKTGLKRVLAGLSLISLGSLSLVALVAAPATAELDDDGPDVDPILISFAEYNNPTCLDMEPEGENWEEAKWTSGTAQGSWDEGNDPGIDLEFNGDNTFDWEGGPALDAVVVKSGAAGHNFYWYSNDGEDENSSTPFEATSDDGLTSPQNISHISFCYDTDVYDLTVEKTVSDGTDGSSEGDVFSFTVDCDGEDFDDAFDLGHGDSEVVSDITENTDCTVTETTTGWTTTVNSAAGTSTTVTMDSDQTVSFHNSRQAPPQPWTLQVTKDVGGNDAPTVWSFDFEVDCGDAIDETLTLTNVIDTASVEDVPEGVSCTVTETAASASGFVVSHSSNGTTYTAGSTASANDESPSVFFLNTRNQIIVPDPDPLTYECSAATDVTSTSATLNGDTDDPDATLATFTLTGNGEEQVEVDGAAEDGWSTAVSGLEPETQYSYQVHWGAGKASATSCEFTTLAAAEVLPDTLVNTPPQVLGEVFTNNPPAVAPAVLARTGSSSTALAGLAAALILLGTMMLLPTRRRELQT